MRRIYVPADAAMLRTLARTGELESDGPVHTVTGVLRAAHPDADVEDLEYTAFTDAAMASVALLIPASPAAGQALRRVVVSADVPEAVLTEHRSGTAAELNGTVKRGKVAAIHIDDADAAALLASPEPDLEALEAHMLDWYAPSELDDVLKTLSGTNS